MGLVINMLPEIPEILQGLPSYLHDLFEIYGVSSALTGAEGYIYKFDFFFEVDKICGQHHIWKKIVLGHSGNIFFQKFTLHQAVGGIGIRHFYAEYHVKKHKKNLIN